MKFNFNYVLTSLVDEISKFCVDSLCGSLWPTKQKKQNQNRLRIEGEEAFLELIT